MQVIEPGRFHLRLPHLSIEWIDVQGVIHRPKDVSEDCLGKVFG
jgi:hypothetical protein